MKIVIFILCLALPILSGCGQMSEKSYAANSQAPQGSAEHKSAAMVAPGGTTGMPQPMPVTAPMPAMAPKCEAPAESKMCDIQSEDAPSNKPADNEAEGKSKESEKKKDTDKTKETPKIPDEAEKPTVLYLSADDSNSQASPVVAATCIGRGRYVDPSIIRTYEFLNYHTFHYPPAEKNSVVIYPEMKKAKKEGEYTLQIAVRSEDRLRKDMIPLNFTFLIDISGSMANEPMVFVKLFMRKFMSVMQKGDRISIVVCNRDARVVVDAFEYSTPDKSEPILRQILESLKPDDITDLHRGVELAYKTAEKNYVDEFLNRVVLLSDGATNSGQLSIDAISKYSKDSEKRGIYLVGVGFGEGFNDSLMNAFTDAGKGAYFFITSQEEIDKSLGENFVSNFDLAVKDVRLKMVMPGGWKMVEFHGEQISTVASEVIPQHLSPNDQMIYHQILGTNKAPEAIEAQEFEFEAAFRDAISNKEKAVTRRISVKEMLSSPIRQIEKGNAVVAFAEMLKNIKAPLANERSANLKIFEEAFAEVNEAATKLQDQELGKIVALMQTYKKIIEEGEQLKCLDKDSSKISHALGIEDQYVLNVETRGASPSEAIRPISRLRESQQLVPREGYKFLAICTGPIGRFPTKGEGKLSGNQFDDPEPEYMGNEKAPRAGSIRIHDLHQVTLALKAPPNAKSFSFDFNYFSAEYPEYVKNNYNDTFYAILEANSTNNGAKTNISFDANHRSIEVDNNYFQNPFHPVSNRGTGFDDGGSTSWLRTSWPIRGGEEFKLTFSIHDEGDEIYDSLILIDNFQWHDYDSVGNTDPLN